MKIQNWQTKTFTLFIAAAIALWLATACTTYYPIDYPHYGIGIASSESCEVDLPLVPSHEYIELAERSLQPGDEVSFEALERLPQFKRVQTLRRARLDSEWLRIARALQANEAQFKQYPHYLFFDVAALDTFGGLVTNNSKGVPTDKSVAVIYLEHMVDVRTVPPAERIPDCIAGIPVHIVVGRTFGTPESQ